jgi:hypothetical protein
MAIGIAGETGGDGVSELAGFVERYPNLLVLTGAGMSTASGIQGRRATRQGAGARAGFPGFRVGSKALLGSQYGRLARFGPGRA